MTPRQRFWLSRFFIAIFLVTTPLVLAYAAGYHVNWRYLRLERTGLLEIKTEPTKATATIDELRAWLIKPKDLTTPLKLKNLRPGNYTVKLDLPGYHSWKKTLTVNPAETTFAKNVRLFKQSEPELIFAVPTNQDCSQIDWPENNDYNFSNKQAATSSIDYFLTEKQLADNWLDTNQIKSICQLPNKKLAIAKDFELWLVDPEKKDSTLLGRFSQPIKQLICLPDNDNYLIYGHDSSWELIELDDRQGHNIWRLAEMQQLYRSAINKKGDQLYFYGRLNDQNGLYSLDL
ncbi:MAG TPA: PEGA domain-containing protein [bacterium]|nr:PEGA domain-containing protein [bacterium]